MVKKCVPCYRGLYISQAFLSLIVLISGQHQQAPQYPAGVDPAACPGFPICDNNLLHNPQARWAQPQQPQPQWNQPQPQWNPTPQPQWNQWNPTPAPSWNQQPSWEQQQSWNNPQGYAPVSNHLADGSGGDKYPAGVNPQACPNYPFCDTNAVHGGAAATPAPPLPGWNERQYPAGVSPQECPNFPYCH